MKYYKIIDDKLVFFTGNVLYTDNATIINPSQEQMIGAGWQVYVEPEPSDAQKIASAKADKLIQIDNYDASSAVEEFTINGTPMWLGHELRQQIRTSADAYEALGYENMTKLFNGNEFTFSIAAWRQMLNALEVYAAEALNVTERHKAEIAELETLEEIEDYDITVNYPEHLNFTT